MSYNYLSVSRVGTQRSTLVENNFQEWSSPSTMWVHPGDQTQLAKPVDSIFIH